MKEKSEIYSLTVINQQGTKAYFVGSKYNGLLLDRIEDKSIEFPDAVTVIYEGLTKGGATVFEVISAPIDVAYRATGE